MMITDIITIILLVIVIILSGMYWKKNRGLSIVFIIVFICLIANLFIGTL